MCYPDASRCMGHLIIEKIQRLPSPEEQKALLLLDLDEQLSGEAEMEKDAVEGLSDGNRFIIFPIVMLVHVQVD